MARLWTAAVVCCCLLVTLSAVCTCEPAVMEVFSTESPPPDLEALQSEARYDPAAMLEQRATTSEAAACQAAGHKYKHGQKIWRPDPCETCLCLDGETFCWWQQCDFPSQDGLLARDNGTETEDDQDGQETTHKEYDSTYQTSTDFGNATSTEQHAFNSTSSSATYESPSVTANPNATSGAFDTSSGGAWTASSDWSSADDAASTTQQSDSSEATARQVTNGGGRNEPQQTISQVCNVLGVEYAVGAVLPRATGNCLRCACALDAATGAPRVVCQPHDCTPLTRADILDEAEAVNVF